MDIPPAFLETDSARLLDFMEQHSFAMLTSFQVASRLRVTCRHHERAIANLMEATR